MIEMIPNSLLIFVHFTVGLLSVSVTFYGLSYLSKKIKFVMLSSIGQELKIAARWCLWAGTIITIATVLAGFHTDNTIKHDTPSHVIMTDNHNWAIVTATVAILIALWSLCSYYKLTDKEASPHTLTYGNFLYEKNYLSCFIGMHSCA